MKQDGQAVKSVTLSADTVWLLDQALVSITWASGTEGMDPVRECCEALRRDIVASGLNLAEVAARKEKNPEKTAYDQNNAAMIRERDRADAAERAYEQAERERNSALKQLENAAGEAERLQRQRDDALAAREQAEADAASERELCSEALRNQGRFRDERDTALARVKELEPWEKRYDKLNGQYEWQAEQLVKEYDRRVASETALASAQAYAVSCSRNSQEDSARREAAETALASARKLLERCRRLLPRVTNNPLRQDLDAWLTSHPAPVAEETALATALARVNDCGKVIAANHRVLDVTNARLQAAETALAAANERVKELEAEVYALGEGNALRNMHRMKEKARAEAAETALASARAILDAPFPVCSKKGGFGEGIDHWHPDVDTFVRRLRAALTSHPAPFAAPVVEDDEPRHARCEPCGELPHAGPCRPWVAKAELACRTANK